MASDFGECSRHLDAGRSTPDDHESQPAAPCLGILFEVLKIVTKNRWPLSGVGIGLAFVLRFSDAWEMFLGAFLFWALGNTLS